jgi:hypothetical protein
MNFIGGDGVRRAFGVELLEGVAEFFSDHRPNWAYGKQHFMAHQTTVAPVTRHYNRRQVISTVSSDRRSILTSDCDTLYILSIAMSPIPLACCLGAVGLLSRKSHG